MVALFLNNPTILNKVSGKTLVLRETFDLRRDSSGADPGFQVGGGGGGGALKKIAPSRGRRENFWGISCEKSRFYANKSYLFPILGGARRVRLPPGSAPALVLKVWLKH